MATIFLKQPASGNSCLVLDTREVFYQQLNPVSWLSDGWTDLRIGMFYSLTTQNGLNSLYTPENLAYSTPDNGLLFGLTTTGTYSPSQFTSHYIGLTSSPISGSGSSALLSGAIHGANGRFYARVSSGYSGASSGSLSPIYPATPAMATGTTGFASYLGMRIEVTGLGTSGQSVKIQLDNGVSGVGTDDTSVELLRNRLGGFQAQSESNYIYYTTGFVNGGGPLPMPSGFIAYSPFLSNRLRIHTILIERFQPLT